MTKFIHIRPPDPSDRDRPATRGGLTLAYTVDRQGTAAVISVGASFCNPLDAFSRKGARAISTVRLRTQPVQFSIELDEKDQYQDIDKKVIAVFRTLVLNGGDVWAPDDARLRPGRFKARWQTQLIGPDGKLVTVAIDSSSTKEPVQASSRETALPNNLGWLSTTPRSVVSLLTDGG